MLGNKKILSFIKQKPFFSEKNFVLYNEDSFKILEELPENSIDMIFADPPIIFQTGDLHVMRVRW